MDKKKKLRGKSKCVLTTSRLILVNSEGSGEFKTFDIPLSSLIYEKYVQPTNGANYLEGQVEPLNPAYFPIDPKFKIYFTDKGATRFLKILRFVT